MLMNEFGRRLKGLMRKSLVSQRQLSEDTGISIQSIRNWTRGKCEPNVSTLRILREYLGCSWEDLLGDG